MSYLVAAAGDGTVLFPLARDRVGDVPFQCKEIRTGRLHSVRRKSRGGPSRCTVQTYFYSTTTAFLPLHFQYKYPGTPASTISVPASASIGRVTIVFNVHAAPMST